MKLNQLRHDQTLALSDLARRPGVDSTLISFYERGKRREHLSTVDKLANALGVEPKDFGMSEQDERFCPPDMVIGEYVSFYDPSMNRRVRVPVCVPASDGQECAEPSEDRVSGSPFKAAVAQAIVRYGAALQILTDAEISRNTEAYKAAQRHFAGREAELWALLDRIPWGDA